jgi:hypothetical protein
MRQDVLHAASCGAHGVVLGMLTPGGAIDQDQLRPFADLCLALGGGVLQGPRWCGWCSGKEWRICQGGGAASSRCPGDTFHSCGCCPAGLDLTFHRAFDQVKDQRQALDDLVACRVRRVLSSGGWVLLLPLLLLLLLHCQLDRNRGTASMCPFASAPAW